TLMPGFLQMKQPQRISFDQWNQIRDNHAQDAQWFSAWRAELQSTGHDGLMIEDSTSHFAGQNVRNPETYAAFEPNQIKSATGNVGTFSAGSDNILFSHLESPSSYAIDRRRSDSTVSTTLRRDAA